MVIEPFGAPHALKCERMCQTNRLRGGDEAVGMEPDSSEAAFCRNRTAISSAGRGHNRRHRSNALMRVGVHELARESRRSTR